MHQAINYWYLYIKSKLLMPAKPLQLQASGNIKSTTPLWDRRQLNPTCTHRILYVYQKLWCCLSLANSNSQTFERNCLTLHIIYALIKCFVKTLTLRYWLAKLWQIHSDCQIPQIFPSSKFPNIWNPWY